MISSIFISSQVVAMDNKEMTSVKVVLEAEAVVGLTVAAEVVDMEAEEGGVVEEEATVMVAVEVVTEAAVEGDMEEDVSVDVWVYGLL